MESLADQETNRAATNTDVDWFEVGGECMQEAEAASDAAVVSCLHVSALTSRHIKYCSQTMIYHQL